MLRNLVLKDCLKLSWSCQKNTILAKPKPAPSFCLFFKSFSQTNSKFYGFGNNLSVTSFTNLSTKSIGCLKSFARHFGKTYPHLQSVNMPEIRFDEVKKLLEEDKITFVDVREPKELTTDGKIPGSINIPLGELDAAFNLSPDKVKEKYGKALPSSEEAEKLVLSCRSGRRAATAFDIVSKHGYQKAQCYFGSFLDWVEKGGSVEK